MSLIHETTVKIQGYRIGDMKIAAYSIAFTANQPVEPEAGFFLLNGAAVSQTTYPLLFARFGSTFNTGGEGAGNFRLPDLTDGAVPVPKGLTSFTIFGHLTDAAVLSPSGAGEINHTLTSGELPAHGHTDTFAVTADSHSHSGSSTIGGASSGHGHGSMTWGQVLSVGGIGGGVFGDFPTTVSGSSTAAATHAHTYTGTINNANSGNLNLSGAISAAGGGGVHNNMGPYLVMGGWLVRHD